MALWLHHVYVRSASSRRPIRACIPRLWMFIGRHRFSSTSPASRRQRFSRNAVTAITKSLLSNVADRWRWRRASSWSSLVSAVLVPWVDLTFLHVSFLILILSSYLQPSDPAPSPLPTVTRSSSEKHTAGFSNVQCDIIKSVDFK